MCSINKDYHYYHYKTSNLRLLSLHSSSRRDLPTDTSYNIRFQFVMFGEYVNVYSLVKYSKPRCNWFMAAALHQIENQVSCAETVEATEEPESVVALRPVHGSANTQLQQ